MALPDENMELINKYEQLINREKNLNERIIRARLTVENYNKELADIEKKIMERYKTLDIGQIKSQILARHMENKKIVEEREQELIKAETSLNQIEAVLNQIERV